MLYGLSFDWLLCGVAKKMRDRRTTTHATHAHPPITTVETGV